jgi:hypothetical protein
VTDTAISWPQLVVLMGFGPDGREDSVRGTFRFRETWQVDASDTVDLATVEHPVLGRLAVREGTRRVVARGTRVRLDGPDGRPMLVIGRDTTWVFGTDPPTAYPRANSGFGWDGAVLVRRMPPSRWEGEDFTRLTGPITATTFLGRPAWGFELAPPPHKPYPLQLTVDAATGMVLRQANRDFGSYVEWADVAFGVDAPDELFRWDGPVQPPRPSSAEAEDAQRRGEWLGAHGLADIALPTRTEVTLHEWDDDGTATLSIHAVSHATLLRRPLSTQHWPAVESVHYTHVHRWSDGRWDWLLGTEQELSTDEMDALRSRLGAST